MVPGEEGVVAEAAKAIGGGGLGLWGPQCLSVQLKIHDPWDHQFFLRPVVPLAPWPVPWLLLRSQLSSWTEGEGQREANGSSWQQCPPGQDSVGA